ncbi:metal-dependent hydrolase family protein [Oceanobacillus timonensis]|uniref:metal-dependent hydrolase family protein n=1 Tax=Oceanobacillus timonensis TaxID=1926285 RepID=UPI0009B9EFE3|nr:amidohydrolase family protein [Oceanobacillus timonensis]
MTTILFTNAKVFTGNNTAFEAMDFMVDTKSGQFVQQETINAEQTIDLKGKYVMPGLINAHTHIMLDPFFKIGGLSSVSTAETGAVVNTYIAADNLNKLLKHGVTYLRDVGSSDNIDLQLSKLEKENKITAPGIIGSGPALVMTGGHGVELGWESDGVDEIRKHARTNIKNGARNIKVMATGGVSMDGETPDDVQLSSEEMRAAVDEAHHKGYTACAHAQGTEGIKNAIRAGVDSIEHGIYLDDEAMQMMLDNNTYLVPTLMAPWAISQHLENLPDFMVKKSLSVQEAHIESIGKAAKAGIPIAMGTDAGTAYNDFENGSAQELELMVNAGLTPLQALQSASVRAAELLKINDFAGSIESGKLADFIVIEENPLENITAIQGEKVVYKKGRKVE